MDLAPQYPSPVAQPEVMPHAAAQRADPLKGVSSEGTPIYGFAILFVYQYLTLK
jgi:hypothetical protein